MRQRTIGDSFTISGIGLQTGGRANVTLTPARPGSGISFVRVDLPERPSINIGSADMGGPERAQQERRTVLGFGPMQIQTTEHLLAALSGMSIDNAVVEIDNVELPGLDGSSIGFVQSIRKAGIVEQAEPKTYIAPENPIWCKDKDALLVILPDQEFRVSYTLSYPVIGTQFFSIAINDESFERELAPARTFCLEAEALELLKRGLGKGANYENTLVMGDAGPKDNKLRFPDEPVRHKLLDLVGDLSLLGSGLKGHVVAIKSGHRLNMELVRKIKETYAERRV